jgi:branched-chain amino acid transport system substrate-binding protein
MSAVALLATGTLVACSGNGGAGGAGSAGGSSTSSSGASTGPIVIGASLPIANVASNPFAADGQAFERGYKLWQKDVNAKGGLLGRKVQLKILDNQGSPTQVVSDYQTLIGKDHVDLIFGPYSSLLTTPASEVAARFNYALVEGAGGVPSVFDTSFNEVDHDVFDVSLPVADSMVPLVNWIKSMPSAERPHTAAFPVAEDPFAGPPVQLAETELTALGITPVSLANQPFTESDNGQAAKKTAQEVTAAHPDLVVLGSASVPQVQAFISVFKQSNYMPKIFIAAAGPDQGAAFTGAVGTNNATGVMVPDGWYPGFANAQSRQMVNEYVAQYGGTKSGVNADVAEAYSVGQVMAQAVTATGGTDNAKIISYLHSGVTLQSVQGNVRFDALGENGEAADFIFQWQDGNFDQVLPSDAQGSTQIMSSIPRATG